MQSRTQPWRTLSACSVDTLQKPLDNPLILSCLWGRIPSCRPICNRPTSSPKVSAARDAPKGPSPARVDTSSASSTCRRSAPARFPSRHGHRGHGSAFIAFHQSPEPAVTGAGLAALCSATNLLRLARSAMYSRASLVSRLRSSPSKIAFFTIRHTTRGRKKYSP